MEHVHGVDVSWMTHGSPRDKTARPPQRRNTLPSSNAHVPPPSSPQSAGAPPAPSTDGNVDAAAPGTPETPVAASPSSPSSPSSKNTPARPPLNRDGSAEKVPNGGTPAGPPQRRGSWFSNISSKFGSGAGSPPQANHTPPKQAEISVPRANPVKNAVLQHAVRYDGDAPYTPAPPKSSQPGLLQVLRRLSSSSGGGGGGGGGNGGGSGCGPRKNHGGLVERRVLNVDRNRERCALSELNQAKLRRVAFCVDVEIAPMPKYTEGENGGLMKKALSVNKKKPSEKSEGQTPNGKPSQEAAAATIGTKNGKTVTETGEAKNAAETASTDATAVDAPAKSGDGSKKKEKKKKSEEERKARKEKKRKLAESNGTIPMEIHVDSDSSASGDGGHGGSRSQSVPTTNPVRIYRRCCQLRETPILKKITEQLSNPGNVSAGGVVEKLDLTAYWLQLPDLVTLGDYLAVVPVKEVLLENCGLNDEGLRVILAGLLASKRPHKRSRKSSDSDSASITAHGGVVERLVLKNNKIGPEGWKHLSLFVYMCRSLKQLDMSGLPFPRPTPPSASPSGHHHGPHFQLGHHSRPPPPMSICQLFAKSLGNRLAGSTLELLNLGETVPEMDHLGVLIDGVIKCRVKRLGLAHNDMDATGVAHVARYLASGACEGLDLGGNDLRDQLETLANSLTENASLAALSLAECNLRPGSLCELFPKLVKLREFRFIDLSHNQDLFKTSPSCISLLRRYLPKMPAMKRIHLMDVAMTSEQAIALAEILPEVPGLAHINLLSNPELAKLADAHTEESQEEACALYASLLAATRVSTSIVAVDIDVPTEQSGEVVKALAKQVVAYSLRNMENLPIVNPATGEAAVVAGPRQDPEYPDVLQHLVGHDGRRPDAVVDDVDTAPDDDYVIGGTGVVKALACCLKNRGDESRRPSGEFTREADLYSPPAISTASLLDTPPLQRKKLPGGKAKDMSKHLLGSARKIRQRLQPAMAKAKIASTHSAQDAHTYQRLLFLDLTLDGIIKRFEDEFPDTREFADAVAGDGISSVSSSLSDSAAPPASMPLATSFGSDAEHLGAASDAEEDEDGGRVLLGRPKALSRSNSLISMTSKGLTEEEGRVLRAGHKFRSGWMMTQQHFDLLSSAEAWASAGGIGVGEVGEDPNHVRLLHELLEEVDDPELNKQIEQVGVVAVFRDQRGRIRERLRSVDPEHWERFEESQRMARANVDLSDGRGLAAKEGDAPPSGAGGPAECSGVGGDKTTRPQLDPAEAATGDEVAVCDD